MGVLRRIWGLTRRALANRCGPQAAESDDPYAARKGTIDWNPNWCLTPAGRAAVLRLAELGVNVTTANALGLSDYTICLQVPHWRTHDVPIYIEIGYLVAHLSDASFPADFPYGVSTKASELFRRDHKYYPIKCDTNPGFFEILIFLRQFREGKQMLRTTSMSIEEVVRHLREQPCPGDADERGDAPEVPR